MSHELTTNAITGQIEFAYRTADGEPWHGLGQPMADGATIDEWRAAAGMNWKIGRSRVRYGDESKFRIIEDQHVLFRSDTKDHLGIVSNRYQIVQPDEMFDFFRGIVRAGGLEMSAAGTIYGGRRFWATAKIGSASPVSIRDRVDGFLLLTTSCDGSSATEARLTSTRVVCKNTLAIARADGKPALRVSHRSTFDPDAVKAQMGLNTAAWDAFRVNITRLSEVAMPLDQAEEVIAGIMATSPGQDGRDKAREQRGFDKILGLFRGEGMGARLDGTYGTAWGLLNAVTEYADHHVRARSDEHRFVSAQWGQGADLKQRAWDDLMVLATA